MSKILASVSSDQIYSTLNNETSHYKVDFYNNGSYNFINSEILCGIETEEELILKKLFNGKQEVTCKACTIIKEKLNS